MMIARLSLLNSLPRLASTAPFLCLIVAQWEWPDMTAPSRLSVRAGSVSDGQGTRRLRFRLGTLMNLLPRQAELLFQVAELVLVAAARAEVEQPLRLLPRFQGAAPVAEAVTHVAEVVPDRRVVAAAGQGRRLVQLA